MTSSIRLLAAALAAPSVLGITASAAPNSTPQPAPQPTPQIEILTIDDIAPAASSAQIRPHAPPAESSAAYIAELAVDVDHEFYLHNGADEAATIAAVQDLLTLARSAFLAGPGVELLITEIVVRTDANDPYTTSDAFEFFGEARAEWAGNPIPHDIVLVISGKDLEGSILGLAALNSICSDDGVALVAPSPVKSSLGSIIVAHELAHLFGAVHCDSGPDCRIMCPFVGGCATPDSFGQAAIDAMLAGIAANGSCLDEGGPGCPADLAEPFGVLDLADVQAFIASFTSGTNAADLAEPFGVLDLADVQAFITSFNAGCP